MKIPVGPALGKLITECTVAELEAACEEAEANVCALKESTHKARKLRSFVNEARPLLRRRKFPTGSYDTTEDANRALRDAAEVGYLLSPSQQLAGLLRGCSVIITSFRADLRLDTFESDDGDGRRLPSKAMLDRVANGLGVSWVAEHCQRVDSQRNPYIRAFQAAGLLKDFDGSAREMQAHAELDLSNGSVAAQKVIAQHGARGRLELDRRRQFITSLVDTQARLRTVRSLGIGLQESYLPNELAKPFFMARLVFHGQTDDPATQQVFDAKVADSFLNATSALFPKAAGGHK